MKPTSSDFWHALDRRIRNTGTSGYLMGWIYAGNALESVDHEAYAGYWDMPRPEVQEDLRENTAFWDRFDTKVSKAAETIK